MSLTLPVAEIISASTDQRLSTHPSWHRVPIRMIADILNGYAFKSSQFTESSGMPLLRIRDVGKAHTECFYNGPYEKQYIVKPGDLVVGMDGDFKSSRWRGPTALLNQRVCKITPTTKLYNATLLELALPAYLEAINENTSSQTVRHLSSNSIAELPIPLPPLAEQARIVAKIDELLKHVNASRGHLAKVPKILQAFRQSVLAAACSGRLTEDWRETNRGAESSTELLQRILAHRKKLRPENEAREADTSLPSDQPEDWTMCSMDALTVQVTSGSRGWAKYYADSGPLFIRAENINTDKLDLNNVAHVQPPDNAEGRRTRVKKYDLLITITGANVTKSALVDTELREAYVSQHVALTRPASSELSPYLYLWTVSPAHGRKKLIADAYGAGKPGLNLDNIREMPVALPPIKEQREIVRRVQLLFNLADKIERRVQAATKRADRLTQAVLAKAFRGEL
ncbi:MAG TPA: restriction endonuclease subunit S, partial [Bryobacteraceae bacterium]